MVAFEYRLGFGNETRLNGYGLNRLSGLGACSCRQVESTDLRGRRSFSGLGDPVQDVFSTITGTVTGIVDSFTGAGASKAAQAEARRIAEIQAQRSIAESSMSAAGLRSTIPWVVGGVVVVTLGIVAVKALS